MRYLRKQVLNRRAPYDQRLVVDANNGVVMGTTFSLTLPKGSDAEMPVSTNRTNGMIRYNTDHDEVQVYQANSWRSLRFKEASVITQDPAGTGDGLNTVFPLNPQPIPGASGTTWDETQYAKQIIVIVGNVVQLANTNYVVILGEDIVDAGTATPDYPYTAGQYYIQFEEGIPGSIVPGEPVTVISGFDY